MSGCREHLCWHPAFCGLGQSQPRVPGPRLTAPCGLRARGAAPAPADPVCWGAPGSLRSAGLGLGSGAPPASAASFTETWSLCPQTSIKSLDGSVDEKKLRELTHRYLTLTARLERLGYNRDVHPVFSEFLINTYGILKQRPDLRANPLHSSPAALRKLVIDVVPPKFLGDSLLLLTCLCELSKEDHKPLFSW